MSDKPFDAEACDIGGQASATNGLTDATNGWSDMKNAPCNRPLRAFLGTFGSQTAQKCSKIVEKSRLGPFSAYFTNFLRFLPFFADFFFLFFSF
jgi:hypothetical protein